MYFPVSSSNTDDVVASPSSGVVDPSPFQAVFAIPASWFLLNLCMQLLRYLFLVAESSHAGTELDDAALLGLAHKVRVNVA